MEAKDMRAWYRQRRPLRRCQPWDAAWRWCLAAYDPAPGPAMRALECDMDLRSIDRLYVTGTDTGAGKTVASCALLHALRRDGRRAVGMKPVASGCERIDGAWRNEDALALQAASDPRPDYADLNPFALPEPLAPELAARAVGVSV